MVFDIGAAKRSVNYLWLLRWCWKTSEEMVLELGANVIYRIRVRVLSGYFRIQGFSVMRTHNIADHKRMAHIIVPFLDICLIP